MDETRADERRSSDGQGARRESGWPAGTTAEDRRCWVCGASTTYRHCKIICQTCGFTRDCSDP